MRILFASTMAAVPWGGSEELWAQAASSALKDGHSVAALLPDWRPRPEKVSRLIEEGLTFFGWREFHTTGAGNRSAARPESYPYHPIFLWRPDCIVISHGGLLDLVNGHTLLGELLLAGEVPYCVIFQANTELYKPTDLQRPFLRAYLQKAARVYFVADKNRRLAERQLAGALPGARIIQNPLNLESNGVVPFPDSVGPARYAHVGRLDTHSKGQEVLFDVLGEERWRGRDWTLDLFGVGDDLNYLEELARHLRIADRVRFRGQVGDIRTVWADHHLLLLPSRVEGTPLVLLEAIACGRSAVVTDIGGNAEWIRDGENGFVAGAPTVELFGEALDRAWERRSQWQELGIAARNYLLAHHDLFPGKILAEEVCALASPPPVRGRAQFAPTPRVTVVIPCYGLARYLPEALDSVVAQTFNDFEVLVVDPSSPDSTREVVTSYQRRYGEQLSLRYLAVPNYGQPAGSRNAGVREARGDLILCLDADDFIAATMLEKTVAALDSDSGAAVAFTDYQCFEELANLELTGPFTLDALALQNRLATCSLYRKEAWEKVGGYKLNCAGYEDWDLWLTLAEAGFRGIRVPETLFFYRVRQSGYLKTAEREREVLLAKVLLNHPRLYTADTLSQAQEVLSAAGEVGERSRDADLGGKGAPVSA